MQFSAQELKEKLLKALDEDNNVVDMPALLEVFSSLEKLQVTKDLLEETRLGKYVNEMRKKTSNKDLAKRAKNLVKKWQAAVMPTVTNTPQFNGDKMKRHGLPPHLLKGGSKPTSPASRPDTPSSVASSSSPGLPSNSLSPKAGFRPVTPGLSAVKHNSMPSLSSVDNTNNSANSTPKFPGKKCETRNGHSNSLMYNRLLTPGISGEQPKDSLSKTDVANKRKRRQDSTDDEPPFKKSLLDSKGVAVNNKNVSVMNGVSKSTLKTKDKSGLLKKNASSDHLKLLIDSKQTGAGLSLDCTPSSKAESICKTPIIKTPRVKTTAELVADLASTGRLNVTDSAAVRKIALNQIDKEKDQDFTPLVPASAKPRPRRKPKTIAPPQTSDASLHETKNEMVHKFLASAIPISNTDLDHGGNSLVRNQSAPPYLEDESPKSDKQQESLRFAGGDATGCILNRNSTKEATTTKLLNLINSQKEQVTDSPSESTAVDKPVKFTLGDEVSDEQSTQNVISDPWSLLPPLDPESIDWSSLSYTPAERAEVNDENLERLQRAEWPGVNGFHDNWRHWNDWTQTYSMPSYNGDHLHILPYVVLDDINEEVLPDISL